jgi:hypothetical protein
MSTTRIIIILFILSEIPVAFYGAKGAWSSLSATTGKRTIAGMESGIALTIYGMARLMALTTNMQFSNLITSCLREIETRSLVQAVTQALAVWILAFAFTADSRPGWLRRHVRGVVSKWQ